MHSILTCKYSQLSRVFLSITSEPKMDKIEEPKIRGVSESYLEREGSKIGKLTSSR